MAEVERVFLFRMGVKRYQHVCFGGQWMWMGRYILSPCHSFFVHIYFNVYNILRVRTRQIIEEIMISTNSIQNRHGFYMPRLREKIKAA